MSLSVVPCGELSAAVAAHPLVLVDVFTKQCSPCRALAPELERLERTFAGRLVVKAIDFDECPDEVDALGVANVPTLVLFKQGEEVDRRIGALPRPMLERWVEEFAG